MRAWLTRWLILWLGTAALSGAVDSELARAHFEAGNVRLGEGDAPAAIAEYETALAHGASAAIYFNLGNAWFTAGDAARALLAYERALALVPGDPEAVHNRRLALERLGQTQAVLPWWKGWALQAPSAFWWWILVGASVVLGGLVMLRLARRNVPLTSLLVVLTALALLASVAALRWWDDALLAGRFLDETALRVAPTADSPTTLTVPAGHPGQAISQVGEFWLVRLPEGARGYVPASAFTPLFPPQS